MDAASAANITMKPRLLVTLTPEYELRDPVQRIVIAVITSFISVIGIPGNILVLTAVATSTKLQTPTNAFVVNLAVTDLATCFILPFIVVGLLNDVWPLPDPLCTVVGAVVLIGLWGSVLNLALIAFNRYYIITKPRCTYDKLYSKRNLAMMLSTAWIVSTTVIILPTMFGIGGIGFSERYKVCATVSTNPYSDLYAILTSGLVQVPSLIVIVTCYVKIYRYITIKSLELFQNTQRRFEMRKTYGNGPVNAATFRRHVQVTKNLFIVICSYILCIMPFSIASLVPPSYPVMPWVSALLILNSCVNPIIYGLKHPQFQEAFKKIAPCYPCNRRMTTDQTKSSQAPANSSSMA